MNESPSAEEIRATREGADLTQTEAAALVLSSLRTWQRWEDGTHGMHPVFWFYFRMQLDQLKAREEENEESS